MQNFRLSTIIRWAYDLNEYQLSGPDWMNSERYDVAAEVPGAAKVDEMKHMLQSLLAERFKLTVHRVTRELAIYEMTAGKNGHKLRAAASGGESDFKAGKTGNMMSTVTTNTSMPELARLLSEPLQRPVADRTGIQGKFDFTLDLSPYLQIGNDGRPSAQGADIPTAVILAVQDQLGLKLKPQKAPVEILVVDHVEKAPAAN